MIAGAIEAHAAKVRYHSDPSASEAPHVGTGDIAAGLATRYAKRAAYHRAEIVLACIVLHLR